MTAIQALPVPAYCNTTLWSKMLTPAQWTTCWKAGWDQPASTAVKHAGYTFGHDFLPAIIAVLVIAVLVKFARSRSRTPVTSR